MRLVRVVADDLTGACDVAGELLPLGRPVRVAAATDGAPHARDARALWVENTQSRAVEAAEAARRVRAAFGPDALGAGEVALKKIDTALRGHVAAELSAAIATATPALVLVAPAIPEVGRTTEGGRQLQDGVPVSETAFGRDPVNPVREASVVETLRPVPGVAVRSVPLETVRDEARYGELVAAALAGPRPVLVADAVSDGDLARSVAAVSRAGVSVLVVGSIGVARALVARATGGAPAGVPAAVAAGGRGVLVVCGSVHPASRAQLVAVEGRWGVPRCEVGDDPAGSGRAVGGLVATSGLGILASPSGASDALALGTALGAATRAAVERHRPAGLVLIGGETAYHCLRALGAPPLEVEARPRPLVVRARVASGRWSGMRVLSKGGSAGDEAVVNDMIALAEDGEWGTA